MSKGFQASTSVARPAEIVWAIMTDFTRAPEWMPGIETVRPKDDSVLAAGKVFEAEISTGGRGRIRDMTLVQWDPDNLAFALSSSEGSVIAEYRYSLQPNGDETTVDLRAQCSGGGVFMKLMWPIIIRMMAKHDRRQMPMLKTLAEKADE